MGAILPGAWHTGWNISLSLEIGSEFRQWVVLVFNELKSLWSQQAICVIILIMHQALILGLFLFLVLQLCMSFGGIYVFFVWI